MTEKLALQTTVAFGDVDRREFILLPRIFKLLQESAIAHANQFGTGTQSIALRGETWVLNRIAVTLERYPRAGEMLRVETWSSGIKGFKGFRDFRVYDASSAAILSASSLWLYISLATQSITRVPPEVVAKFPVGEEVWCPELEKLPFPSPGAEAASTGISLRYSDIDVNAHVNNAAYLELVQTALMRAGVDPHPRRVRLKYAKAIPADTEHVKVRLERFEAGTRFSIDGEKLTFAVGEVGE